METKKVTIVDFGPPKGLGVLAAEKIKKGDYIVSYLGDVIFETEANKREAQYEAQKLQHYYLYVTNVRKKNPETGRIERLVLDPTEPRPEYGWARLMNASKKQPNIKPCGCRLTAWPFVEIQFFAIRDIDIGEELLYDYDPRRGDVGFRCI